MAAITKRKVDPKIPDRIDILWLFIRSKKRILYTNHDKSDKKGRIDDYILLLNITQLLAFRC